MGSAALDLAFVACGRFDAFWEHNLSPWDMAAGILIVREAGGFVTRWTVRRMSSPSARVLAANANLAEPIRDLLAVART